MNTLLLALLLSSFASPAQAQGFAGHTHDVLEVKFNPDATRLISYSAGDGWLCLWEARGGRLLWQTKTEFVQKADEYYTLTSFSFSPDGSLIASGSGNGTVQLWDAKTGKPLWLADAHADSVTAVEFSPDGKTVVSAASPKEAEDEIKVLRVEDGGVVRKLAGRPCTVIAMRFDDGGRLLRTGDLDGKVSGWSLETGKQDDPAGRRCVTRRTYEWEVSFSPDLNTFAKRTGEQELTVTDARTNTVRKKLDAAGYRVYSRLSADGNKLIVSDYGGFTFHDLATGETRKIDKHSRTGSVIDLSPDGRLFADGGSWGDAAVKITETKTGKSWQLGGPRSGQRIPPHVPSELELRLTREQGRRLVALKEARARRDAQAAVDTESFRKQVYITFSHYGDMTDPGEQRIMESNEPKKSRVRKPAADANAVWLRLHNDSPLPIEIPTQSMYLPDPKCFHEFPTGRKLVGLCDGREISVWHGLRNKRGEPIPYGFDFGSSAILLPKTWAIFAVPRRALSGGNAISFGYTFQKETEENKVEDYGTGKTLKFGESDLPGGK